MEKFLVIQLSLMGGQKPSERLCAGWVVSISEAQAGGEERLLFWFPTPPAFF